ncbi:MAG TPA: hypothetical protein VH054_08955, partial [Polyangiaceae bacterium]|nr:hypothetical protein [Polyangiaceae bacterium]
NCETTPGFVEYCSGSSTDPYPCQGHVIDATHWESGSQFADFLNYGAEQTFHVHFRDAQNPNQVISGELESMFVQISAQQQGNSSQWINGADQLSVASYDADESGMTIRNDTCGAYFFRVVVTLIPPGDAGSE